MSTGAARPSGHSCAASGQTISLEGRWREHTEAAAGARRDGGTGCSAALTTSDSCSDEITRQQAKADAPAWTKRINLAQVAMTGHSFGPDDNGAGRRALPPIRSLAEPRISAFIAFSPTTQGPQAHLARTLLRQYGRAIPERPAALTVM